MTFTWSSEFKGVTGILTTDAKDPRQNLLGIFGKRKEAIVAGIESFLLGRGAVNPAGVGTRSEKQYENL